MLVWSQYGDASKKLCLGSELPNAFTAMAPTAIAPAPRPITFLVVLAVSTTSNNDLAAKAAGGHADVAKATDETIPVTFPNV